MITQNLPRKRKIELEVGYQLEMNLKKISRIIFAIGYLHQQITKLVRIIISNA